MRLHRPHAVCLHTADKSSEHPPPPPLVGVPSAPPWAGKEARLILSNRRMKKHKKCSTHLCATRVDSTRSTVQLNTIHHCFHPSYVFAYILSNLKNSGSNVMSLANRTNMVAW